MPIAFRYASYHWLKPTPSHVYVVTKDEQGKEIIVDGVWHYFNSEKSPAYKITKPMDVITLAGMDEDVAGIGRRKRRVGAFSFHKKIALAPNRRAFRTLVSLNLFGLARKLQKVRAKNPAALRKFWERIGGKYSELEKSVRKGYNHWAKRHKKVRINGIECCVAGNEYYESMDRIVGLSGIGAAPAVAAIVAAGAPIIAMVAGLVKKSGADKQEPGEPPMDEAVSRSQEIRGDNPQAESQMNISGLEIGLAIGARKRKGRFARRVKKMSLAPNRRAFRTLIAINAGGLAYKLARVVKKNPNGLRQVWEKLGGQYPQLIKSIKAGLKRVPARRRKAVSGLEIGYTNPQAFTATQQSQSSEKSKGIVALATTIIKALAGLLKKHGDDGQPQPGETTFEKILNVADSAATEFGQPKESASDLVDSGQAETQPESDDEPKAAGFGMSAGLGIAALLTIGLLFSSSK